MFCHEQPLLPVGLSDTPNVSGVKLFCPCCKEVYNPPEDLGSERLRIGSPVDIDGAFFGTTFPHMFLLQYPEYLSSPSNTYNPTIFGYKIHPSRSEQVIGLIGSPFYTQSANNKRTESDASEYVCLFSNLLEAKTPFAVDWFSAYHLGLFLQSPSVMPASYYDVLNVRYDATPEELKRA